MEGFVGVGFGGTRGGGEVGEGYEVGGGKEREGVDGL